ncbi:MAG: hypothetical protein N3C12_04215 [Candidatus Binatia bacterium]|nr:hypothetical protein [Candidatus Binatia bacterium]
MFLKGEYIRAHDGAVAKEGSYVSVGYRFRGLRLAKVNFDLQPVARWEGFDPDLKTDSNLTLGATVGFNFLFDDYFAKIQLNHSHFEVGGSAKGDEDLMIAALQVAL